MGMPQMGANTPALTPDNRNPNFGQSSQIDYNNLPAGVDANAVRANPQGYIDYRNATQPQSGYDPARFGHGGMMAVPANSQGPQAPTVPATDGGDRGAMQQPQQPNIFNQSAGAYTSALDATRRGMNTQPANVTSSNLTAQTYDPSTMQGVSNIGFNSVAGQQVGSQGYDAQNVQGVNPLSADQVTSSQISQGMAQYQNPFEQQVVDTTLQDLERQRQMQINDVGSSATAAGAFGGSRQGVMEAETNRAAQDTAARTAAQLRSQGFAQAADLSGRDIQNAQQANLANQRANLQAGTTTAQQAMQAQLANQQAQNQAGQFGAQAANQAGLNQAQMAQQAALANQAAGIQTGMANASNQMATQQANMQARNQAGQFGAGQVNQINQANQARDMQAQLANQANTNQYANRLMSGGSQLGNLSNLGFNMGNTLNQNQMAAGNQQQALMQALIDAGRGQTQNYYNSPQNALNTLIGAYSGSQTGQQSQQNTMSPGLFDFLSLGAQAMSGRR